MQLKVRTYCTVIESVLREVIKHCVKTNMQAEVSEKSTGFIYSVIVFSYLFPIAIWGFLKLINVEASVAI